jgi:hypothetical protein
MEEKPAHFTKTVKSAAPANSMRGVFRIDDFSYGVERFAIIVSHSGEYSETTSPSGEC